MFQTLSQLNQEINFEDAFHSAVPFPLKPIDSFWQRTLRDPWVESRFVRLSNMLPRGCEGTLINPKKVAFLLSIRSLTMFTLRDATDYQHLPGRRKKDCTSLPYTYYKGIALCSSILRPTGTKLLSLPSSFVAGSLERSKDNLTLFINRRSPAVL